MSSPTAFPIVGIGASAGGIEALEGFFRGLPDEPGLAVVIVTQLDPQRESTSHDIIARCTSMTVQVAADGMLVVSDKAYVLPAGAGSRSEAASLSRRTVFRRNAARGFSSRTAAASLSRRKLAIRASSRHAA